MHNFRAVLSVFIQIWLLLFPWLSMEGARDPGNEIYIRINQVGYLAGEHKSAILFSAGPVRENFSLIQAKTGREVLILKPERSLTETWGAFDYYYTCDFSRVTEPGVYLLEGKRSGTRSPVFRISDHSYDHLQEDLLAFMRQQRCGYNPTLDMVCHQHDGRSFYGPMPDSSYLDVSGGWHDAGDMLKYLITGSYATAHMLLSYDLYPDKFEDRFNALGQPGGNGIPDLLDEARWGLDWIFKLHPAPDQLVHQLADDRDHVGWKMPDKDRSDYGWGPDSYRAAYFATGEPQGLNRYQSEATGVSNLAGRCAAAMALAARIWEEDLEDPVFAQRCLEAAKSLYSLGRKKEGFQQGNSYGAPYRYGEQSWADDMEWGAAELYKTTGEGEYLEDARKYARMAGTVSWMPLDTAEHYRYYPFINMGHFALFYLVEDSFRDTLSGYYRQGIESCLRRGSKNPYGIGIPFIWCSNNLLTSLITQVILYERMTGDKRYDSFLLEQRDWLFGRNPWGTSMFTGIPADGEYPLDIHTSIWALRGLEVPGGLVDGPVYGSIFRSLIGLQLNDPDEFAVLQNPYVVYHDDMGDYSTNEPTMDGTAGSILMMAHFAGQ
ncbi:MAG: glycoside hydrolase family 9 protein [Bacteroidales bacterium]|nr:glycoside hydrolase family 9 protein [Bacteroidales bacterium]